jgi:uncharacterized protein (TIGR02118 family)
MLKVVSVIKRKEGLSQADFLRAWSEVHAPMAHHVPGVRGFILNEIVRELSREDVPDMEGRIDGIAEAWFDDLEAMRKSHATPQAKEWFADGPVSIGEMRTSVLDEMTIIPKNNATSWNEGGAPGSFDAKAERDRSGAKDYVKVISLLQKKPDQTLAHFMNHWTTIHKPMAHAVPGVGRYTIYKSREELKRPDIPDLPAAAYDGIAECYYANQAAMDLTFNSPEAAEWFKDGALFIGKIRTFVLKETVVI